MTEAPATETPKAAPRKKAVPQEGGEVVTESGRPSAASPTTDAAPEKPKRAPRKKAEPKEGDEVSTESSAEPKDGDA